MQTGTVVAINSASGMFIVKIDGGDYVVFELLDGIDIQSGHHIRGDLEGLGSQTLQHIELRQRFSAEGQSGPSSLAACRRLL